MINQTGAYKPYQDERRIGARMSFALVDVNAQGNVTVAASGTYPQAFFAQPQQVVDGIYQMGKWATPEDDGWLLDGSYDFIPENTAYGAEVGLWGGAPSGSDGNIHIYLELISSVPLSSSSFSLVFDNAVDVYPTDFVISTYNASGRLLGTKVITDNNSANITVNMPTEGYTRVLVRFSKMCKPYKIFRICEFVFGELREYGSSDIVGISCTGGTSVFSEALPANEAKITIDNSDRAYNLINPSGVYRFLQQGQALNIDYFINGTPVNMGRYFFAGVESSDNAMTATITAYDRMFLLDTAPCNIGSNGTWTVAQAVAAVIAASGINITTFIPADIGATVINKCIPQGTSCREALRLIAQAAQAICFFTKLDVLTFVSPALSAPVDVLNYDRVSEYPTITDTGLINYVELNVRNEYNNIGGVYIAQNIQPGEKQQTLSVDNPLAYNGQAVADWILQMSQYRIQYDVNERGNPAREFEDTITIFDAYGEDRDTRVIEQEFSLSRGLKGRVKAVTNYV